MAGPVVTTLLGTNPSTGTLAANTTEQTLDSGTAVSGTFMARLDLINMVDGHQIAIKGYTKAKTTERLYFSYSKSNAQIDLIEETPPIPTAEDIKFTVQIVAGANINIDWSILNLNGT